MKFSTPFFILTFFSFGLFAQITTYTFENGKNKAEGNLAQGIEQGLWKFWDKEGNLIQEVTYKDGEFNGPYVSYHLNGEKKEEGSFDYDHIHGSFKTWYKSGKKESEGFYNFGFMDSLWTIFYESGGRYEEGMYKKDVRIHHWKSWYQDGMPK